MTEFLQNFHFLRPWVLLFFIIPIGVYFKNLSFSNRGSSWENICDKKLLGFLLVSDKKLKKISIKKFIYSCLIATVLAAAGPCWQKTEIPTFEIENPTMFVLSLAQDMQLTDITPSRLERAKFMISDITENVPEGQFGLEVYSQEPYVITPLTNDVKIIKSLLPQIVPNIVPDSGDRLDRAIALTLERFKSANFTSGNIVIFASDVGQRLDLALDKVKEAASLNYAINIVDTSYSGNEKLQMLAEKSKGVYFKLKDGNMQKLLDSLHQVDEDKIKLSQNLRSNYLDYGYYLVFISLLCMLPFFRRGLLVLLFFCCFISPAYASFLLNDNQEGLLLFKGGQYEMALNKFKDSVWRGVTLYKLNKNEDALKEFSKEKNNETAIYNKGVVLTKLCQYTDALAAFNEVLKINPNNDDALYNRQVLDELLIKAKDDPSVLSCNDNQQQQNNQQKQDNSKNQSNNQDNNQQQNSSDRQDKSNQDNQSQEKPQDSQSDDQQQRENQQNSSQKNAESEKGQQSSQENSSNENQQSNSEQKDENESSAQNNEQSNQNDENSPSQEKSESQANESKNTPTSADSNQGDESKSQNENGDNTNGSEEQMEDQDVGLLNAKQGDENTQYDEEALAVQRRYREIPEDVGGLLREFIKKEHLKGRYRNDN